MLRSLFSAISGLRANQFMLDVTGNNIANANTVGYKASNVVFQDTLSPDAHRRLPRRPATRGGTNPIQVGLGVQVGGVTTNFGQGSAQVTGKRHQPDDLRRRAVRRQPQRREPLHPRGRVQLRQQRQPGHPRRRHRAGLRRGRRRRDRRVTGPPSSISIPDLADENAANPLTSYNIGTDGVITGIYADGTKTPLFQIALANFANPEGLDKVGDTAYRSSTNSGAVQFGAPGTGRRGALTGGQLEMSNVDLAQEFTNLIIAQRGFQATSRVITTSDQVLEELVNIKR